MTNFIAVYITTTNLEEARKIGKKLVEEKLVGCANIIPAIESIYQWEGKMVEDPEALLICKSKKSLSKKIIKRVKELHSYTVPCVSIIPILEGNKDYFDWLEKVTEQD